ncbi:MAG TPA: 3-(methylthio)propionyl-CoA ligase [Candidatus Obscuribacterales bacterium]
MKGLMMDCPLLISSIIKHAERHHGRTEIVSRRAEGDIHRYTYTEAHARSRKLANVLGSLGCKSGDRVGTLAWNGYRHLEIYYGTSGSGMIVHTINPRLFPEQIAWIINHAEDNVLFFDLTFLPLVESIMPTCPSLRNMVLITDRRHMPKETKIGNLMCYEDLVDGASDEFEWPALDENSASGLCYTSGTTGHPKGALYSHRSTVLHAFASALPDAMCVSARDTILPVVPMFHVNAWGFPYSAPLNGAKLVFPGPALDGKSLYELFESEKVTFSAGVPTVWLGVLEHMQKHNLRLSTLSRIAVGGAACPPSIIRAYEDVYGVTVNHAWGMTELSPVGSMGNLLNHQMEWPPDDQRKLLQKQGRVVPGIDWKIVDQDGKELPWDGKTSGNLLVRGAWVIDRYFKSQTSPLIDGWFPTGDVSTIDTDGFMQITDRSKDVIKSGGEWISSIELENLAMAHPAVHEAAVIGCRHPKWDERPLLVVVRKSGGDVTAQELLKFFEGKVAKWWIPDDVAFVDELPHTATGKVQKLKLRERFADFEFSS